MLKGKKILLGVSGSIAAYKSTTLVRLLVGEGAEVQVVMTESAKAFITPLTLSTLSKNEVHSEYFDQASGEWNNHVELALWADLILIAPATANTIAKMANGICDNLLLAVYLSAKSKVMVAPAMDREMYEHGTLKSNLVQLKNNGNIILEAEEGELASGLMGKGRMQEPESILEQVRFFFNLGQSLAGQKILVNAGPTYESIDPVRFIGNRSSGKMGIAIANELHYRGAKVIMVLGPSNSQNLEPSIELINVESAAEMYKHCTAQFESVNAAILSAAVADYRPAQSANQKIKKDEHSDSGMNIDLIETDDVLGALGKAKKSQILVGFALETQNGVENAKKKIEKKNLDFIVLNSLEDEGAGFGHNTNKITIIEASGEAEKYELKTKQQVAVDIVNKLTEKLL